jgi:hypothetical protein
MPSVNCLLFLCSKSLIKLKTKKSMCNSCLLLAAPAAVVARGVAAQVERKDGPRKLGSAQLVPAEYRPPHTMSHKADVALSRA